MSTAVTVEATVHNSALQIVDEDLYRTRVKRAVKKWGEGCALIVRIELEEEALTAAQRRYYFGRILGPFVDYTGYRKDELHDMVKSEHMPDGKTSITQLNHDEMRDYSEACEQTLREWCPDAYALYDQHSAA